MTRKYIDCREFPSEMNCTVALAADSDEELVEAAVQHAVAVHHHVDGIQCAPLPRITTSTVWSRIARSNSRLPFLT